MKAWGMTDIGLRRQENQDRYAIETFGTADTVAAVVCDGMGGVNGGRLASSLAVETFIGELRARGCDDLTPERLRELQAACVAEANHAVYRCSQKERAYRGMGTTLVSAIAVPGCAVVCNVGDSRGYHIGADGIRRVTRDHSVVESLLESGDITPEEARTHPNRNIITRALGPDSSINSDSFQVPLAQGDRILLCTDGLIVTMTDQEMFNIVSSEADGAQALDRLLALSIERGAPDNVTAVLIEHDREVERQNG